MVRFAYAVGIVGLLALPGAAQAQGLVQGARQGAAAGDRALGPIGGVVGGAVGAGVGTVNGALGIHPHYRYRCYYKHGHRYCR